MPKGGCGTLPHWKRLEAASTLLGSSEPDEYNHRDDCSILALYSASRNLETSLSDSGQAM